MREAFGDIWIMKADALCITTNGIVTKDGRCVMGRGVALQAKERLRGIDFQLGRRILTDGNIVHALGSDEHGRVIVSFPVKHHWRDIADGDLIVQSARQLVRLTDERMWTRVVLPRPGCGNGQLDWRFVRVLIASILDDRFIAVTL